MRLSLEPINDPHVFDSVVSQKTLTSALQGWGYGEARRTLGVIPDRFLIRRNEQTVGALQLLRKPLFAGLSTLYVPRGPALDDLSLLPEIAQAVRAYAKASDVRILIEPPLPRDAGVIPERLGPWIRTTAEQPEHTIINSLDPSEEELFARLHTTTRRNVRKAQKLGVTVARDDDFEAFWQIFSATNQRAKLGAFPRSYYETLLREAGRYGGEAYLILARYEGKALAGGFFLGMGKEVSYLYGGSIKHPEKDVQAPTAFYWHALLDAKQRGYTSFDFWGIPRQLSEDKHSFGLVRMKESFGGEKVWFPGYGLDLSPLAPAVTQALRWRKNFNNYRRRGTTQDIL